MEVPPEGSHGERGRYRWEGQVGRDDMAQHPVQAAGVGHPHSTSSPFLGVGAVLVSRVPSSGACVLVGKRRLQTTTEMSVF